MQNMLSYLHVLQRFYHGPRWLDTVIFEIKKCYSLAKVPFLPTKPQPPRSYSVLPPYIIHTCRAIHYTEPLNSGQRVF